MVVVLVGACTAHVEPVGRVGESASEDVRPGEREIELAARTPYLPTYPCGEQCHDDRSPDPTPRRLTTFHAGRIVAHGPALDFCDDCHDLDDVDSLVLLDGTTRVSFDGSDGLCAQCHGAVHDDWEAGIHGISTGGWQGLVERRLCTACHDPHAPGPLHFEALPVPTDARRASAHEASGQGEGD